VGYFIEIKFKEGRISDYQKWNGKIGRMLIRQTEKILLKNNFCIFFYIQMSNISLFKDTLLSIK
jgi:hypothetical protein